MAKLQPGKKEPNPQEIERQVQESLRLYPLAGALWRWIQYLLGISAIIISALPTAKEIWSGDPTAEFLGNVGTFLSPLVVGVLAFLRAGQTADAWFRSWRMLERGWGKYHNGEISAAELLEIWYQAENVEMTNVQSTG